MTVSTALPLIAIALSLLCLLVNGVLSRWVEKLQFGAKHLRLDVDDGRQLAMKALGRVSQLRDDVTKIREGLEGDGKVLAASANDLDRTVTRILRAFDAMSEVLEEGAEHSPDPRAGLTSPRPTDDCRPIEVHRAAEEIEGRVRHQRAGLAQKPPRYV